MAADVMRFEFDEFDQGVIAAGLAAYMQQLDQLADEADARAQAGIFRGFRERAQQEARDARGLSAKVRDLAVRFSARRAHWAAEREALRDEEGEDGR